MGAILIIVISAAFLYCIFRAIYIHHTWEGSRRGIGLSEMSRPVREIYFYLYGQTGPFAPQRRAQQSSNTPRPSNIQRPSNTSYQNTSSRIKNSNSNNQVNETGEVVYFANDNHGLKDKLYKFNFVKNNGSWKAYILRMPALNGRDANYGVTHRLRDDRGTYVCWDSQVKTLKDMKTVAKFWADCIQEYIATGKRFG